ncbi:regulatory protein RecX [Wohlfahrtiimonas larvae]|uniref:Regulatory protein RecX n=1 Tax=Wohlfahrtiimonas larvae TaxID=1157986 RepID=A0ABP9MKF3_9GAMM|nr:regulatory protein RecX [Wohlfahrtiimonas larvae]
MADNRIFEDQQKAHQYWFERALNLLMRREHSIVELKQKLTLKGCESHQVDEIIERCIEANYLSIERFAEVFTRNQVQLGYGPKKIQFLLKQHQVPSDLISIVLEEANFDEAKKIALRKIGQKPEVKLKAALYRRGF